MLEPPDALVHLRREADLRLEALRGLRPVEPVAGDEMRRPAGDVGVAVPDVGRLVAEQAQEVDPGVDTLDEGIKGLSSFGTLLVVPGGGTQSVGMSFALPANIVLHRAQDGSWHYLLNIRRQPGTAALPITIRVHLPTGSTLESPASNWTVHGRNILIKADLRVDFRIEVVFQKR